MPHEQSIDIELQFNQKRESAYRHINEYVRDRTAYYRDTTTKGINLKKLLSKDIIMFAARGVTTSDEFAEESFKAIESSSEETVMGNRWQAIIAAVSSDTIDSGDITTVRDGVLWICELKSQPNTTNSSSFPQELRALKAQLKERGRYQRASKQPLKAAFCILRSNKSIDEMRTYHAAEGDNANRDLNGFEYRHLEGKAFWKWLVGTDSPQGLINDTTRIEKGDIVEARQKALARVKRELNDALDDHKLPHTIDGVLELKRVLG